MQTCDDVYVKKYNERVFRETDDSPEYQEKVVSTHICRREKGHGGDHIDESNPYEKVFWWYSKKEKL